MSDTTVIITLWRRNYLEEQLNALLEQTVPLSQIWLVQHENYCDFTSVIEKARSRFKSIHHFRLDLNLKFYIRFSFALNISTRFTWVLDDDVIPGKNWLDRSIETHNKYHCIVCPTGRIIAPVAIRSSLRSPEDYAPFSFGDTNDSVNMNYNLEDTYVDYGCSGYFFETNVVRAFWQIWPNSLEVGDDIHLSAVAKIVLNIPTIVPAQLSKEDSGNLKRNYGGDRFASWRRHKVSEAREIAIKRLIDEKGWVPLKYHE